MVVESDLYQVRIRFEKLFADPGLFEDPANMAKRYLVSAGLPSDKAAQIYQTDREMVPVDDLGNPSRTAGAAKYRYKGQTMRSEYMRDANLSLEYADFGSGFSPEEHRSLWKKQRWADMKFVLKQLHHQHLKIEIPDISELYQMLKARADPTTLASIELPDTEDKLFHVTVAYLEAQLRQLAEKDGRTVEVYAARDMIPEERHALERRLARESTPSTVHIILSRASSPVSL